MKNVFLISVCLLLGVGIGWYLGYSRPVVTNQRKLLKEYESLRDDIDLADPALAETIQKLPQDFEGQFYDAIKNEDEMLAVVGLATFKDLERGDTSAAKSRMVQLIGSYYFLYHDSGGNPDTLAKIKEAASEYPAIADEISK
jgi:hypothetical protein